MVAAFARPPGDAAAIRAFMDCGDDGAEDPAIGPLRQGRPASDPLQHGNRPPARCPGRPASKPGRDFRGLSATILSDLLTTS